MAAALVRQEELAIALELAIRVAHLMVVIVPAKGNLERFESEPLWFLRVPFGLLSLSDHAVVHRSVSFRNPGYKRARVACTRARQNWWVVPFAANTRMAGLPLCESIAAFEAQVNCAASFVDLLYGSCRLNGYCT